jgi:hypothetical protein
MDPKSGTSEFVIASDYIKLKQRIVSEIGRRRYTNPINDKANDHPYTLLPAKDIHVKLEHYQKIINDITTIISSELPANQEFMTRKQLDDISVEISRLESRNLKQATGTDCANACAGGCQTSCFNSCISSNM